MIIRQQEHPLLALLDWFRRPATRVVLFLGGAILLSSLAAVVASHQTRSLFGELERARLEHDRLLEQRGRLLLERSTFSAYGRVESVAVETLDMQVPASSDIRLVRP
jgi:cell division protein FtsL